MTNEYYNADQVTLRRTLWLEPNRRITVQRIIKHDNKVERIKRNYRGNKLVREYGVSKKTIPLVEDSCFDSGHLGNDIRPHIQRRQRPCRRCPGLGSIRRWSASSRQRLRTYGDAIEKGNSWQRTEQIKDQSSRPRTRYFSYRLNLNFNASNVGGFP